MVQLDIMFCSVFLSVMNLGLFSKSGEVVNSHLILKLLGILFSFMSFNELSFFFTIVLVRFRHSVPKSIICALSALCCDAMTDFSVSNSGESLISFDVPDGVCVI